MKLDIDKQLHTRLSIRAQEKGLDSPEEYSILILETVIEELESSVSTEETKERLEDLGYLE